MLRAVVLEQGMFSPAGLAFLLIAFQIFPSFQWELEECQMEMPSAWARSYWTGSTQSHSHEPKDSQKQLKKAVIGTNIFRSHEDVNSPDKLLESDIGWEKNSYWQGILFRN